MQNKTYNQIVYGSLLHPSELKKHGISMSMVEFVKIKNFKRIFNQEPSYRESKTINRAVLNIQKDDASWLNAILIKNVSIESIKELDIREIGYDRVNLEDGLVTYYNGKVAKDCIVYIGKKGKQNSQILPNIEYFKLCKDGAKCHFDEFYTDYLNTTFLNNNLSISQQKEIL